MGFGAGVGLGFEHAERGLAHVGVRVAGAFLLDGELALERTDVDDVPAPGQGEDEGWG